jgi:hypothetical protein
MSTRLAAVALCAAAAAPAARAGVTITSENQDKTQVVMVLEGNKIRSEDPREGGVIAIFDGDAGKMIQASVSQRTYTEMTQAQMKAMRAQMDAAIAQMTPEQRAQMESMGMGAKAGPRAARPVPRYEPMGKKETVAGYKCEWYRELVKGKAVSEGCYMPWGKDALTREDLRPMKKMGEFLEALMPAGESTLQEDLDAAPGFPAIHVDMQGEKREVQRLVSIRRGSVGADRFRPPAGYRKTEQPM